MSTKEPGTVDRVQNRDELNKEAIQTLTMRAVPYRPAITETKQHHLPMLINIHPGKLFLIAFPNLF